MVQARKELTEASSKEKKLFLEREQFKQMSADTSVELVEARKEIEQLKESNQNLHKKVTQMRSSTNNAPSLSADPKNDALAEQARMQQGL